jgi:hypothetical protein
MDPNEPAKEPLWCPLHRIMWRDGVCFMCASSDQKIERPAEVARPGYWIETDADRELMALHHSWVIELDAPPAEEDEDGV